MNKFQVGDWARYAPPLKYFAWSKEPNTFSEGQIVACPDLFIGASYKVIDLQGNRIVVSNRHRIKPEKTEGLVESLLAPFDASDYEVSLCTTPELFVPWIPTPGDQVRLCIDGKWTYCVVVQAFINDKVANPKGQDEPALYVGHDWNSKGVAFALPLLGEEANKGIIGECMSSQPMWDCSQRESFQIPFLDARDAWTKTSPTAGKRNCQIYLFARDGSHSFRCGDHGRYYQDSKISNKFVDLSEEEKKNGIDPFEYKIAVYRHHCGYGSRQLVRCVDPIPPLEKDKTYPQYFHCKQPGFTIVQVDKEDIAFKADRFSTSYATCPSCGLATISFQNLACFNPSCKAFKLNNDDMYNHTQVEMTHFAINTGRLWNHKEEKLILKRSTFGYTLAILYAEQAIKGRWPRLERLILRGFTAGNGKHYYDTINIIDYATKVIKDRWPEGEHVLLNVAKDGWRAWHYYEAFAGFHSWLKDVPVRFTGRWIEAEPIISAETGGTRSAYAEAILKCQWEDLEKRNPC